MESIRALLEPRSVAVVGASPTGLGGVVIHNLASAGYSGKVCGVNPKYDEVFECPCVANLGDVPFKPDAVVLAVGRERVVPALEAAVSVEARSAVVFAIGFAEADALGDDLQRQVSEIASDAGIAVLGPNCQGLINFARGIPLWMEAVAPYAAGRVGLVAQSGAMATSLANNTRGVRWSHVVSSGNEAVVTTAELLAYYVECADVDVICAWVEAVRDPEEFFQQCDRAWAAGKPVVVCTAGRTQDARAAAAAHSGALAVPQRLLHAALDRHNAIRVESLEEMLETANAMVSRRRPRGSGVAFVAWSGGQIQVYHDSVAPTRLETPAFSGGTQAKLREMLPSYLPVRNPLDWWGMSNWGDRLIEVLECVATDPSVDIVLQIADFGSSPTSEKSGGEFALESSRIASSLRGDALFVIIDPVGGTPPATCIDAARGDELLVLSGYDTGLLALGHLAAYCQRQARGLQRHVEGTRPEIAFQLERSPQPLDLLAAAGLDVARSVLLGVDQALDPALLADLGFPVVAKIGDTDVLHKTELGGVVAGICSLKELEDALDRLRLAGAEKVLVQEQICDGVEIFLGVQAESDLGAFLIVGLGGIWTEVLDDVQIRPVGISREEAVEMVRSLRGYPLLSGGRGTAPRDVPSLIAAIMRLDAIGSNLQATRFSLDINPLIVTRDRATVVDAVLLAPDLTATTERSTVGRRFG